MPYRPYPTIPTNKFNIVDQKKKKKYEKNYIQVILSRPI